MNSSKLRDQLTKYFNKSELYNLCFDLNIKHENLPANTLEDLARELITYCHRHNRFNDLIERCKKLRPHVAWSDVQVWEIEDSSRLSSDGNSSKPLGEKMIIEAFSIPVLLKATNFLFDEAGKILQERRERRQAEQRPSAQEADTTLPLSIPSGKQSQDVITSKNDALKQMINENTWQSSQAEIEHLISLLEVHTRNYYLAQEQYAKWGSALVPPIIMNNLKEAEDEVAKTSIKLQNTLSRVYGKRVAIPEAEEL